MLSTITPTYVARENEVIAFAELEATDNVTIYVAVEPSAAVTKYFTADLKLFEVFPLICVVVSTLTLAPVVVNVATKAVRSVP